jgi:hypothetical protein
MNCAASVAPFLFFEGAEQLRNLPSIDLRTRNPSSQAASIREGSPSRKSFVRRRRGSASMRQVNRGRRHRASISKSYIILISACRNGP